MNQDQPHLTKSTYESISSSVPTYESFSSQQNNIMEDQPIDVDNVECGDNKRKRKAPSKPRKTTSECWKYFDAKFEPEENGDVIKMAYCKWCPAVFKADSVRHGTRALNTHYVNCDNNPDVEKLRKQKKLVFKKKIGENDEGVSSLGTLETWKHDEKVIKQSLIELIVLAELSFKFVENGCIPMEVDEESDETPMSFLTDEELCDKLVKKVEKDMGVLFAMYKEKYGTNISNDIPKPTSSQSSNTSRRRGNSFLNAVKDKLGNKLSGGEDELTKYLKEPRIELEDDNDFDILNWWKVNSPRFPIVSRMAKDILCIQVSTVASESAFSASGRVLDPYRNSLAPNIIEALVCTQDWIRTSSKNITMDTFEDLMKDDELAKEIQEALDKQKGEHEKEKNFAP